MSLAVVNTSAEIAAMEAALAAARVRAAEQEAAQAEEAEKTARLQKDAEDALAQQLEQTRQFEAAVASANNANRDDAAAAAVREALEAPADPFGLDDEDLDVSISAAASESGASAGAVQPSRKKRKDGENPEDWLGRKEMEVSEETPLPGQSVSAGSGSSASRVCEERAGEENKPVDALSVDGAWLKTMFEQSQVAINNSVENQLGPVMASLREMRVNAATKSDLELFKAEVRQEVDARLKHEAQGLKRESSKTDPFTRRDPWVPGAWDKYKPTGASSSGSEQQDQGSTSQIPVGKWRPDGAKAKAAVGESAATFQQQQQAAAGSTDFVPSQVFIRGWSNWGDTNGITKTRATEIWIDIKKQLAVEDQRLVINGTV